LPENHECTFELKHVPVVPTTPRESRQKYQKQTLKKADSRVYLDKGPRTLKKYLRRQDKLRERTLRSYQRPYARTSQYQGTKTLFIIIILFSIVALVFNYNRIPQYIYLSLNGLAYKFMFHTMFTSLFISSSDILGLFFLFIMLIILYFMARNIESIHGTKFLIKLYIVSGLFSALFYVLLRISLISIYPLDSVPIYVGLAWGGILGLLSYSLFPMMNRKITGLMYFLPIRMSGRSLLLIIVLLRLLPLLFFVWYEPAYIVLYLPDLGGILGAYIIYKYQFRTQ